MKYQILAIVLLASLSVVIPFQVSASTPVSFIVESGLPQGTGWAMELNGSIVQEGTSTSVLQTPFGLSLITVLPPPGYNFTQQQVGQILYVNFTATSTVQPPQTGIVPYEVAGTVLLGLTAAVAAIYRRRSR